jgi:hypothetical protein
VAAGGVPPDAGIGPRKLINQAREMAPDLTARFDPFSFRYANAAANTRICILETSEMG